MVEQSAMKRWLEHYEDCEICMEGAEADEFNDGAEQYCSAGSLLRGDVLFEKQR